MPTLEEWILAANNFAINTEGLTEEGIKNNIVKHIRELGEKHKAEYKASDSYPVVAPQLMMKKTMRLEV
ncbi:hypothetical protein ACFL13_01585 [Patescibacteria group bacterium]